MKITIKELRRLIRETVAEANKADPVDQDEDGDNDFEDVKIARMKASGLSHEKAVGKVAGKGG